jgi:tRNA (guanine-N7-)-methyltransferase
MPTSHVIPPENLVIKLRSLLERLELAEIFPATQPLEVELGSGDASFLVEQARRNPRRNFIGVERLAGRICKVDRKGKLAGLKNVRGVRLESEYFLQWLLPPGSVSVLHVYFPDPWPKKRHLKNRLINENFLAVAHAALVPQGVIYLRTDDADYFAQMREVFAADKKFQPVETPAELAGLLTDFERAFNAAGVSTLRAAYQRLAIE